MVRVFAGLILQATRMLPARESVAVATLVIAALFDPLRIRVQHAVDRRFNVRGAPAAPVRALAQTGAGQPEVF